jgi:hypothetical protein
LVGYLKVAHFSIPAKPMKQNARRHIPKEGNFQNVFLLLSTGFVLLWALTGLLLNTSDIALTTL